MASPQGQRTPSSTSPLLTVALESQSLPLTLTTGTRAHSCVYWPAKKTHRDVVVFVLFVSNVLTITGTQGSF